MRSLAVVALFALAPATAFAEERAPRTISFDEAVKLAVKSHPTAQRAALEVARLEALQRQSLAASLPTVGAAASVSILDADRVLGGSPSVTYGGKDQNGVPVTVSTPPSAPRVIAGQVAVNVSATLAVPVFAPRAWAAWSHAGDASEVAKLSRADAARLVAFNAARAYLAVVGQRRVVEVATRSRDTAKAHFDFTTQRLAGGVGNKLDVARSEQEWRAADAQVEGASLGLARAREALGVAVGEDAPLDAAADARLDAPSSVSDALDSVKDRSDVKVQSARIAATEHLLRDGWTDYAPLLSAAFQPFFQNPASLTTPTTGWQAQVVLALPLYDGGARYGAAKERRVLLDEATLDRDALMRQAHSDVRAAFEAVRRADAALVALRGAADASKRTLELATTAYQAGATSNLELIDAERRARDAETQVAVAEDAARQARLELLLASGRSP